MANTNGVARRLLAGLQSAASIQALNLAYKARLVLFALTVMMTCTICYAV